MDFKTAINTFGRQLDGQIIYQQTIDDESAEIVLTNEDNISIKPRFNIELFKTIMKIVEFETTVKIPSKLWVQIKIGVVVNESYEYVDYGEFYINEEPEYNVDTNSYSYKAYDKMIESMVYYGELDVEYPITFKEYLIKICERLGWVYDLDNPFPNQDSLIERDLYKDLGMTYRGVLDDLSAMAMGNFINDGIFKILFPTNYGNVINDNYLSEDNITIMEQIKPVNVLSLSRAEGGDKIFRSDVDEDEEISEIEIKDNIILSSEYREDYIDEMFDFVKGFTYVPFDIKTTGTLFMKPLEIFVINHDGIDYETILLNYEIEYGDGLTEVAYSPTLSESVTDFTTASLTDRSIKNAVIIAYKNDAKIELMASDLENVKQRTSGIEISVEDITSKVEEIDDLKEQISETTQTVDGLAFKVEKIGGQNLIINSVGQYGTEYWESPHDIINGLNEHYDDVYNNSNSKSGWEFMKERLHKQIIDVPQGTYTISAKFKKLLENAEVLFNVNGLPYNIENADGYELNEWVYIEYTFNSTSAGIEIRFTTDSDNSCLMTDLMLNGENIALTWQPANGESILGNTRIGINGVEVGDKSKENTSLTDTGLRMYYGTTEVGRSTATGMKANKYEGSSFDIGNVTLRDMENINQTWLTRR